MLDIKKWVKNTLRFGGDGATLCIWTDDGKPVEEVEWYDEQKCWILRIDGMGCTNRSLCLERYDPKFIDTDEEEEQMPGRLGICYYYQNGPVYEWAVTDINSELFEGLERVDANGLSSVVFRSDETGYLDRLHALNIPEGPLNYFLYAGEVFAEEMAILTEHEQAKNPS